ncbi:unnamed protein product [Ascophyllum nodosum]
MKMTRAMMLSAVLASSSRQHGGGAVAFLIRGAARIGARGFLAGKAVTSTSASSTFNAPAFSTGYRWNAPVPSASYASRDPLRMMFQNPFAKKEVNYEELQGSAKEAAEAALKGEVPSKSAAGLDIATFAGGCFWGLELAFQRVPGVVGTSVGYTQGSVDKPTYGEVCSGSSGHTEAVQVQYDPSEVSFEELLGVFFGRIDPTQADGQSPDFGPQYRSGVYHHTSEQQAAARAFMEKEKTKYAEPIATELEKATVYWPAELYHQQYLSKGGRFGLPQSAEKGATDIIRCYG